MLGSYFYSRANGPQNQGHNQLYLNSGCIVAQVKYMRWLFAQALSLIPVIRDDQQIFVRTFFAYPDMITLDHNHQFAMTFYQQNKYLPDFTVSAAMQLYLKETPPFNPFQTSTPNGLVPLTNTPTSTSPATAFNANKALKLHPIGIAHANNKGSNTVYPYLVGTIFHLFESYFRGRGDGKDLFQVLRYMADKQYKVAKELLTTSASIRQNTTTGGGKNGVNSLLMYEIEHGLLATNESSLESVKGKLPLT